MSVLVCEVAFRQPAVEVVGERACLRSVKAFPVAFFAERRMKMVEQRHDRGP